MTIYLLKSLNDYESLCATQCTEELIYFSIVTYNCQASYTFHETLNKKNTLCCSKQYFLKKLENQDILFKYKKFSNWFSKLVLYLISNWDDNKSI